MITTEPLHLKYRPQELNDVVGQEAACRSLATAFHTNRLPHTFLFTGPSGCGKTTLARIVASLVGCESPQEVDAAKYSGADAMREWLRTLQFAPMRGNVTVAIVDECHALSKQAWDVLLKATEEPPKHLYWCLCTTAPDKVPQTIRTRAHAYEVRPVKWDVLAEYMLEVAKAEGLKVKPALVEMAARQSGGSVRQALVFLSVLNGIVEPKEAAELLQAVDQGTTAPALELARALVTGQGATWDKCRALLEKMQNDNENPEGIRLLVLNYATKALLGTKDVRAATRIAAVCDAFSRQCHASEKFAPLALAVATLVLQ